MTTKNHSPHWLEKISADIANYKTQHDIPSLHVDDMKTPSGRVHTGALRGVVLHDLVAKVLQREFPDTINTYVFNDMDPMDALPGYLDQTEYSQHMGKPLFQIPVPALNQNGINLQTASPTEKAHLATASNFGEVYALDFIEAFTKLGCQPQIIWSHELYQSGKMDPFIRLALDNVDIIRKIYVEVAEYTLPPKWYPFQVICPNCGKVGTTLVTDWDGQEVSFECQPHKVTWAEGCGFTGKISPFGGTGKLLWKMDWPAHWAALGVNVEGAGKDHSSAGGSRDMADQIIQQVFKEVIPFNIPYEWILIRGTKMSSSKGIGTSAREFVELFPAEVGRFLFIDKPYWQVIDFDPQTMSIPDLFDAYDEAARVYWHQIEGDHRLATSFEFSQVGPIPEAHFLPRFRDVALWMQHPEIELSAYFAEIKGEALNSRELEVLAQRQRYAQLWVNRYAPEEYRLTITPELPAIARNLTPSQRTYLLQINELLNQQPVWEPAELQQRLFDLAKQTLGVKDAFASIYLAFLGKTAGPRAAWFLLAIDPVLRNKRLAEITTTESSSVTEHLFPTLGAEANQLLSIEPTVSHAYPSIILGVAIIRNVQIAASNAELEAEKAQLLESLTDLTVEKINEYSEIQSYRNLYREMHIDWHSRRPSPEALLRRLAQGKSLYSINTCVDAYNLVVLRNRVSVGAFDLKQIHTPTQLRTATGGEQILLLGDQEPTIIKPGELCYFDQAGPYNLDFNYRDAQRSIVTEQTTDLVINVDGIHSITRAQVEQTLQQTITMIQKYCGGTLEMSGIIETQGNS